MKSNASGLKVHRYVLVVATLVTFDAVLSFVPATFRRRVVTAATSDQEKSVTNQQSEEYKPYDWQRVGGSQSTIAEARSDMEASSFADVLPDLPDFSDDSDDTEQVPSLGAKVKIREINLPDLPGDPDLLPPPPNPLLQGGLGLFEWTGIWLAGLIVIAALAGAGSYALARAKLDPDFANTALIACKILFGLFQVLFLARVMLSQFPKINTTEMPWALVHYPTEWALAPTRAVFKPEAGVDIAPILWLMMTLLAAELLTGPAGILQMAKEGPRTTLPPGMSVR